MKFLWYPICDVKILVNCLLRNWLLKLSVNMLNEEPMKLLNGKWGLPWLEEEEQVKNQRIVLSSQGINPARMPFPKK